MANSLGGLIVTLGLDASTFVDGLTKSERQAQKFADNARRSATDIGASFTKLAGFIGGLGLGAIFIDATKEIISSASALNDFADATGSSVEDLSRLSNQAKIAGTDFATLQTAVLKLSAGMAGTDEESTKAKEALKLLGIATRDPAQAMQEIALKFDTFADGVNKVGLAVALFGKQGAGMVATLKDIAQLQDIASTTTTKQAQDAEKLEQAFRRLSYEATGFKNAILSDVVPALTEMIREFSAGITVAGGLFNALRLFGTLDLSKTAGELRAIETIIDDLEKQKTAGGFFSNFNNAFVQRQIDDAKKQREFLQVIQRQQQEAQRSFRLAPGAPESKPDAPFISNAKGARATKEAADEAAKYIEALEKQRQAAQELDPEMVILLKLYELQATAIKGVTVEQERHIRFLAAEAGATAAAKKAAEEKKRADEEALRILERNAQQVERFIESTKRERQSIDDSNRAISDQIVFLTEGAAGLKRVTDARLDSAIAAAELVAAMKREANASEEVIEAQEGIVDALKMKKQLAGQLSIAEELAAEKRAAEDFGNAMADSFGNAFEGFILGTKNAKDAFKDFALDVERYLVRLALQNLGKTLFGGSAGGPDVFSLFAKFLGAMGGAGGGIGYAPGVEAMGPPAFAVGTNYVPRDMLAMVHRGERVTPAAQNRSPQRAGNVYHITIPTTVMPGATTASVRQTKAMVRDAVVSATRER